MTHPLQPLVEATIMQPAPMEGTHNAAYNAVIGEIRKVNSNRFEPIVLSEEDYAKWRKQILLGMHDDEGDPILNPDPFAMADRLASSIFVDSYDSDQSIRFLRRFVPAIEAQLTKEWSDYWHDVSGNEVESLYDDYMLITMILVDKDLLEYGTSPRCCWVNNPRRVPQPFLVTDDQSPSLEEPADTYAYLATVCRMARELYEELGK